MNIYDINFNSMDGKTTSLESFKNKTILIVNTASKCGFTKQFEGLETLYKKYKDNNFVIIGFPCNQFLHQDPGSDQEILSFCQLKFGVSFPMMSKINVKGKEQHPLYSYLIENTNSKAIKWNFEKFLISSSGEIIDRFESKKTPSDIEGEIKKALNL